MGMIYGSMRHSVSGKRKKANYWKKTRSYTGSFQPLSISGPYRRETPDYPSAELMPPSVEARPQLSKEERNEISSQYTVAPAYNKGAYQVIAKENIKHIGR